MKPAHTATARRATWTGRLTAALSSLALAGTAILVAVYTGAAERDWSPVKRIQLSDVICVGYSTALLFGMLALILAWFAATYRDPADCRR